jgi:hypothetical protein
MAVLVVLFAGQTLLAQDAPLPYPDPPRVAQTPQVAPRPQPQPPATSPTTPPGANAGQALVSPFGEVLQPTPPPVSEPPAAAPPAAAPGAGTLSSTFQPAFSPEQSGALGGQPFAIAATGGYIDSAIPRTYFGLRYDDAYGDNRPDRAEFFYAKSGSFALLPRNNPLFDPRARGPSHPGFHGNVLGETNVNYQEVAGYLEVAPLPNMSAFIEVPARFLNAVLDGNAGGFSDINMGFKYAFVAEPDKFYTFQFRTYVPTGDPYRGLGTGHPSLEPALLVFRRLTERAYFIGEVRDWIPIQGSNYAGNVIRYGMGAFYNVVLTDRFRVAPVSEFVGWTVFNGKETEPGVGPVSAAGDTIVNAKIGVRIGFGQYGAPGGGSQLNDRSSIYIGYAHALTGDFWYKDMLRLEYNFYF